MISNDDLFNELQKITQGQKRLEKNIKAVEKNLRKEIHESQEDTITVLSELIHTGYNLHEKRIKKVEDLLKS